MLSRLDLRATEFGGVLLVGAQLESACLRGTRLALTDLSRANLRGADARGIVMANSVLQGTDLRGADLRDASLLSAVLDRTQFQCRTVEGDQAVTPEDEAGLCRCPAEPLDAVLDPDYDDLQRDGVARGCRTRLNRAAMNGVNVVGADFSGADLSDTGLTGIEIGDAQYIDDAGGRVVISIRFQEARFDGANLAGVAWNTANLTRATLRGANLSNAQFFENSTYENIVLTGADLSNTVLADLDMRGWDLQNTTLLETDLRGADARYVSFDGAVIDGPLIDDAQLRGASFEGVKVMRTFDPRLAAERRAERAAALADPDAFDPFGSDATLEGISFRGAHFIAGDISWMSSVSGLNLDDAAIGVCTHARDSGPASRPVSADADFRFVGATLRGAHAKDLSTGLTCGIQWWRIMNARTADDISATLRIRKSDLSGARFSVTRLELEDSLAEGAELDFDYRGPFGCINCASVGANAPEVRLDSLRSNLGGAQILGWQGNDRLSLGIRLSDLSGAEFSGSHLRGVIERSVIQGAELNARAGLLAQWRGMEFRMLDFTDTALPRDLRVFYDRGGDPWSARALIADSYVPPGTTVDISEWKGVEVVRTDLRGVALRVTADPVELPETTTSRVITLANCSMRGLTVSTPANGAVPTVLDLESVDVRPLAAGALALRNPSDLVTYWRVRGGDVLEGGALDDALSALPAGQRRAVAGPLLLPFPDRFDRGLADARVRGLCAPDPTGSTCHIPLPPERAGAFPVLTGATLASLAGLDAGEWEGANLSEATLGAAAGAPVALALEAGSIEVSGASAGAWGSVEAPSTRTGLSLVGSTLRNVAVALQRGAGGAQVFSALNLMGTTLGAGFSWADATPPSAVTLGRATVDPSAVLRGCVDCSAHGARSAAGAEVSGAGLLGLLSTAAHLDLSQADLVARVGEPLVLEPAEGVSLVGAQLDGRVLFGPLPSAAPVALWGASLGGGVVGGHVLLAGATGDAVTLRNSLEGAVFGRHGLNISTLEPTVRLPRAVLWDAVSLQGAELPGGSRLTVPTELDYDIESGSPPTRWFSLRRANLSETLSAGGEVVIAGADLRCADFRGFRGGRLKLNHVNLDFADFRGADLSAISLNDSSARYLLIDEDTTPPAFGANTAPRRNDLSFARGEAQPDNEQRTVLVDWYQASAPDGQGHLNSVTGRFDRPDRVPFPDCAQSP